MRRLLWPALLALFGLLSAGCSSLTLGYGQAPRLLGWWVDGYLDLDRAQSRQLDAALRQLHDWHRRDELPQWVALLQDADATLSRGFSEADLQRLERAVDDSLRRTLQRAAPLAQPLLAQLSEAQWAQLQRRMAEKQQEWREREAEQDAEDRSDRYLKALRRWLGELPPPAEQLAQRQAAQWPADDVALWHERREAQLRTLAGLRAWAAGDLDGGTRLMLAAAGRDGLSRGPASLALRQRSLANALALLRVIEPAATRRHWARWQADLRRLRDGG